MAGIVIIATMNLVIGDNTYIISMESVNKGTSNYGNGKMDHYGTEMVSRGYLKPGVNSLFLCALFGKSDDQSHR